MLMYPIFITDDADAEIEIKSLPGQKRWGINKLEGFLRPLVEKGLRSVILFGVPVELEKVSRWHCPIRFPSVSLNPGMDVQGRMWDPRRL